MLNELILSCQPSTHKSQLRCITAAHVVTALALDPRETLQINYFFRALGQFVRKRSLSERGQTACGPPRPLRTLIQWHQVTQRPARDWMAQEGINQPPDPVAAHLNGQRWRERAGRVYRPTSRSHRT